MMGDARPVVKRLRRIVPALALPEGAFTMGKYRTAHGGQTDTESRGSDDA